MRQKLIWQGMQVIEKMERETGLEPATSSLGSWHSTTELLPHSGIQPHYSTSICTCVLYLDHFQQGPAGQRGGLVVQFKNTMRRVLGNGGFEPIALP
jgi:hypothetical protein